MNFINKENAITKMNSLGSIKLPFIFIIDYLQKNIIVEEIECVDSSSILYDLNGLSNLEAKHTPSTNYEIEIFPQSIEDYEKSFNIVKENINKGNSYLVNLTCSTPININLQLNELFFHTKALYKLMLKDRFIIFSPETFIRIKNGYVYSYPMKGTIDASLPNAESIIMNDPKEAAEHATIVDLIRNDLSIIASHVSVPKYRYIDRIQTNKGVLLQVSSEVRGKLQENWQSNIGSLLFSLLPAGSISGAPKKKTQEIIAEAETYNRGFYTGIMGYFDGENLDSAVMIRFIEKDGDKFFFKSGGGITSQSELNNEYNEMIQKIYVPIY